MADILPKQHIKPAKRRRGEQQDLKIEAIEGEEMTPEQFEATVQLLFNWWRREFEKNGHGERRPNCE